MRRLGKNIGQNELSIINALIGKRIWFIRCPHLSTNLIEKSSSSSYFQIPFFWTDGHGNHISQQIEINADWTEDNNTLADYYTLNIKLIELQKLDLDYNQPLQKTSSGLNSSIHFKEFIVDKIEILSRHEIVNDKVVLNYDEGILLISKTNSKILIAAELQSKDQIEIFNDEKTILKRVTELKTRITLPEVK